MTAKKQAEAKPGTKSRMLEAVHDEATQDLHRLGFIDKRKQQRI